MYNNAMDIIQLVFGFVNAPLFATFLLGMFWARTTGTGAFLGLLGGTGDLGALPRADTSPRATVTGSQRRLSRRAVCTFPSEMAQNFWLASFAFIVCFVLTLVISLATQPDQDRRGTQGPGLFADTQDSRTKSRPGTCARRCSAWCCSACCVVLNIIFW